MKKFLFFLLLLLLLGAFYYEVRTFPNRSYGKGGVIDIKKGEKVHQIAQSLKENGLISSAFQMRIYLHLRKFSSVLQAGEYKFDPNITPKELVDKLVKGESIHYSFTIPEGYSIRDIAKVLYEKKIISDPNAFIQKCLSYEMTLKMGIEGATNLEGYLYPDTYEYTKDINEDQILKLMVKNFKKNFPDKLIRRAKELGMTVDQTVTLASIIEKETARNEERALVSSVFHNRLKKGIPLATDPTIIYGIPNFDGNIRKEDLLRDGPYNTYLRKGLPPTPIANPGVKSLEAALYPAKTEYLFFVGRKDGSHQFSKTLAEHNAAVQKYQLLKSPLPTTESKP